MTRESKMAELLESNQLGRHTSPGLSPKDANAPRLSLDWECPKKIQGARLAVALAVAVAAVGAPVAKACIEHEPRQIVEFQPGSAVISGTELFELMTKINHARSRFGENRYRVSVRGFADRATEPNPVAWKPEDVALADARARALSEVLRTLGSENCVERVAIGNIPSDPAGDRVDAKGVRWLSRGLVVFATPENAYPPRDGLRIETDCGPPPPARAAHP